MLQNYNDLHTATGRLLEQSKSTYFAQRWKGKQGNKEIINRKVNIRINNKKVKEVLHNQSEKNSQHIYKSIDEMRKAI